MYWSALGYFSVRVLNFRHGGLLASHLKLGYEGLWKNNETEVGFGAEFICRRTAKTNWYVKMLTSLNFFS